MAWKLIVDGGTAEQQDETFDAVLEMKKRLPHSIKSTKVVLKEEDR